MSNWISVAWLLGCCFPLYSVSRLFCVEYKCLRFHVSQQCFRLSELCLQSLLEEQMFEEDSLTTQRRDKLLHLCLLIFLRWCYICFQFLHSSPFFPNFLPLVPSYHFIASSGVLASVRFLGTEVG